MRIPPPHVPATASSDSDNLRQRLIARATTIDELLSDDFEAMPGQKARVDLSARRLAAWCRSSAGGDWSLFNRRLERDRLSIVEVLARFAAVRRRSCAQTPAWIEDAIWIEAALQKPGTRIDPIFLAVEPCAFAHLLAPLIEEADARLWREIEQPAANNLNDSARASLRHSLLKELSSLCAPALYERFEHARNAGNATPDAAQAQPDGRTSQYDRFVAEMKAGGCRQLFAEKPILLRLIASLTRQWIETSHELVMRLHADWAVIRQDLLRSRGCGHAAKIESELSDRHNGGRSVRIISFESGARVVHKPKDLRVDVCWHALIERLNRENPPVELKAARSISREGYGWAEFIDHARCAGLKDFQEFFRRAGAWLALFHCFAAGDMHQENMIAAGAHPIPIDLETILQAVSEEHNARSPEQQAFAAATATIADSILMVGLLPVYARSPDNNILAMGGMISNRVSTRLAWDNINSDSMRPRRAQVDDAAPNLPHIDGDYARFADFIDDFVSGFEDYAHFLLRRSRDKEQRELLDGFAGLPVRKLTRPTRFYYMLLQRLRDHRTMDDGPAWAAQTDFIARLADWDNNFDPVWPLQQAERAALVQLNVPHFVSTSDGHEIRDARGTSIHTDATPGLHRAHARIAALNEQQIAWQIEVIRQNTNALSRSAAATGAGSRRVLHSEISGEAPREFFALEVDKIAGELSSLAIRRGPGAAWIGVDWLGDSEVSQLVALGPDLYNGNSGIAVFFAAHAAIRKCQPSRELALAAVASLRRTLKSRSAARFARSLGVGGAAGLGSIVYALILISECLQDSELLEDAHVAAELFSDELIAADKQLDVMGGSAGAILALLSLHRFGQSGDVLQRATKCGEHLLAQPRVGAQGRRSWRGQGSGAQALNGMSHGAAGFAYALSALFAVTGREELMTAASECIAFEDSSYDAERGNWRDLRDAPQAAWPCQWCHGGVGIGLARLAMAKHQRVDSLLLARDVARALDGVERAWPNAVDTLCCGTLGSVELLCEAGRALDRRDLCDSASRRLMAVVQSAAENGDYQWNAGSRQFNLNLFRGLAGTGYTLLRRLDASLPSVLVWE